MPFLRSYHVNGELLLRNRLVLRLGTFLLNRQLLERLIEIGVLLLRIRVTPRANGEDFHEVGALRLVPAGKTLQSIDDEVMEIIRVERVLVVQHGTKIAKEGRLERIW